MHYAVTVEADLKREVLYKMGKEWPKYLGLLDISRLCRQSIELETLEQILESCPEDKLEKRTARINGRTYDIYRVKRPSKLLAPKRPLVEVCRKMRLILPNGEIITKFVPKSKLHFAQQYVYDKKRRAYNLNMKNDVVKEPK